MSNRTKRNIKMALLGSALALALSGAAGAATETHGVRTTAAADVASRPWMNVSLTPDERARLLNAAMTNDERFVLLHGSWGLPFITGHVPAGALGSAGFYPANERLGIPALQESDASLGVTDPANVRPGDHATALPSTLLLAATFDRQIAFAGGQVVGNEARLKGFNVQLAGGVDLARDPRNGRNFEYAGEDPLLAGTIAGEAIRGIQSEGVISTVKHYALNDQETGRNFANAIISEEAARESDLLAFEIAIEKGHPGSVMCSYNLVNGAYACGNDWLLNAVLKRDWGYKGWVMSDWGAVKSPDFALKGLDQESGQEIDKQVWFDAPLRQALANGQVRQARIEDMTRRILRSMFAAGLFDHPGAMGTIDYTGHASTAQSEAAAGIVLLKNEGSLLPLAASVKKILVIGGHADAGVLSGAGSSQVTAGPDELDEPLGGEGLMASFRHGIFHASSPLRALRQRLPNATISFYDGRYPAEAARLAKAADLVIVFGLQWMGENEDAPDLSLPSGQDDLIEATTTANPHTVVVLETGGPVVMPWLDKAGAVLEAWYPGERGGDAIADIVVGAVNPSGRLPLTFPRSLDQYPRVDLPGRDLPDGEIFDVPYNEGAEVGYRRFAKTGNKPLFPFGFGLSYSKFQYSALKVTAGPTLHASLTVTNTGSRDGDDAPQVYVKSGPDGTDLRLVGFDKVALKAGESKTVDLVLDPRLLASFDVAAGKWRLPSGTYTIAAGRSAADLDLATQVTLKEMVLAP